MIIVWDALELVAIELARHTRADHMDQKNMAAAPGGFDPMTGAPMAQQPQMMVQQPQMVVQQQVLVAPAPTGGDPRGMYGSGAAA